MVKLITVEKLKITNVPDECEDGHAHGVKLTITSGRGNTYTLPVVWSDRDFSRIETSVVQALFEKAINAAFNLVEFNENAAGQ